MRQPHLILTLLAAGAFSLANAVSHAQETRYATLAYTHELDVPEPAKQAGQHAPTELRYALYTFDFVAPGAKASSSVVTELKGERQSEAGSEIPRADIVNIQVNWANASAWTPYLAAGGGSALPEHGGYVLSGDNTTASFTGKNAETLYQFVTGAIWEISPAWEMEFTYKHLATEDALAEKLANRSLAKRAEDATSEASLVEVGVTYRF